MERKLNLQRSIKSFQMKSCQKMRIGFWDEQQMWLGRNCVYRDILVACLGFVEDFRDRGPDNCGWDRRKRLVIIMYNSNIDNPCKYCMLTHYHISYDNLVLCICFPFFLSLCLCLSLCIPVFYKHTHTCAHVLTIYTHLHFIVLYSLHCNSVAKAVWVHSHTAKRWWVLHLYLIPKHIFLTTVLLF